MTDKNGNITFPALSRNSSDTSGSSEHDQAVRTNVQEHPVALTALTHKFLKKLGKAAKKVFSNGDEVNYALLHLGGKIHRGVNSGSAMTGLGSRGVDRIKDLFKALNNGRSNDVIAVDVQRSRLRSEAGFE